MIQTKKPHIVTTLPGPKAQHIVDLDGRYLSPSYTRSYPLVAARGQGAMVEDVDGNIFLDFSSGISVVSTGHCHPEVVEAIQQQAAQLIHMSGTDFYYPQLVELASKLEEISPGKTQKRVFFTNSGTESVEAAIKLARFHTKREKLLAFYGGFHGRTMGALSLTASKAVQRTGFGALLAGVHHVSYPYPYRCPYNIRAEECCTRCFAEIEETLFKKIVDPSDLAAIIVEPIQGEGGHVPAPLGFLQNLQEICRKHGIVLISDEVQSGVGRTGKWWAGDHAGLEPDIICIAKGIASGMPLGAIVAKQSVMTWSHGSHGSTFGGNPVSIAAALATLRLVESEYMDNASVQGAFLLRALSQWPSRHKIVGDVRGKGLMIGVEIVQDQQTKTKGRSLRDKIIQLAFEKGLLLLDAGENSIRLTPSLVIDREQAECALAILDESVSEVEHSL
jgi:4-aminobutyrate aminotransferase